MLVPVLVLALLPAMMQAAPSAPLGPAPASANVRTGVLAAIDAAAGTLSLRAASGTEAGFRLTDKTLLLKQRKPVERSAFSVGETVVIRFRRSAQGTPTLYDLVDRSSWDWLQRIRRTVTEVTVREITETRLACVEGADAAPIDYRVTGKTAWGFGAKVADASAAKVGARLFVAPRLLPGGGVMAMAAADTRAFCLVLQERSRPTAKGTIAAVNAGAGQLTLKAVSGDVRGLKLADKVVVRRGGKDVGVQALRVGLRVTLHLRASDLGEREVSLVTIQTEK